MSASNRCRGWTGCAAALCGSDRGGGRTGHDGDVVGLRCRRGDGGDVTLQAGRRRLRHHAENSSEKYWNDVAEEFEKGNPGIKVEVSVYSWKDVDRKVAEMVKAGKAPDIAQIGAYADYAEGGQALHRRRD